MRNGLEIKCLDKDEQARILREIDKTIAKRIKDGLVTEKEIREIEEKELPQFPDVQDVQSVYTDVLFRKKGV